MATRKKSAKKARIISWEPWTRNKKEQQSPFLLDDSVASSDLLALLKRPASHSSRV